MNTQEAQQAHMIAEIKAFYEKWLFDAALVNEGIDYEIEALDKLLKIVDSQAQKIADLNRVGSNTLLALIEAQEKIAEQAKEIERLKSNYSAMVQTNRQRG